MLDTLSVVQPTLTKYEMVHSTVRPSAHDVSRNTRGGGSETVTIECNSYLDTTICLSA